MRSLLIGMLLVAGATGCIHIHTEAPRIPGCPPCPCAGPQMHLSASDAPDAKPDAPATLGAPKLATPTAAPASPR